MNRRVLVTGSSRGIGKEIALFLAKDGFDVTVHCRSKRQMAQDDYGPENIPRDSIISSYQKLLDQPPDKKHKELYSFYKRIIKYRDHVFPFLYDYDVPPDNNASERAIRNIKVKQKISGQFRSLNGAKNFAIIRSIIDTLNKRNLNVFQNLELIANFAT